MFSPAVHGALCDNLFYHCAIAAIATVVTIAEILKNNGLAVEKSEARIYVYLTP